MLKAEVALHPEATMVEQQRCFDAFRNYYNFERPHEGIGMETPASRFEAPGRCFVTAPREPYYPGHWERVRVRSKGKVTFRGERYFICEPVKGEEVGLVEVEDGVWKVSYFDHVLGLIDTKRRRFTSIGGKGSAPRRRAG